MSDGEHVHDEDCDSDTPSWPWSWTIFLVVPLILVRDIVQAFANFAEGILTHTIAFHNKRVDDTVAMDELRMQIESIPLTNGQDDGDEH